MANKLTNRDRGSNVPGEVSLFGKIVFGSSDISSTTWPGVSSVVRDAAGRYTLTLSQQYNGVKKLSATMISALTGEVRTPVINADNSAAAAKTVTFRLVDGYGNSTDPTSGVSGLFELVLKNSGLSDG